MTKKEKREIAAAARTLITLLKRCDDEDYIDEVIQCVCDSEFYPAIDPSFS